MANVTDPDLENGLDKDQRTYRTVYSPTFLSLVYDHYVLGFNMRFIWGCPTDKILTPFFAENFSRRHLDVGVATGYLPAKVLSQPFRRSSPHDLTLLDISANSLAAARARVLACTGGPSGGRTTVATVEADATAPLPASLAASVPQQQQQERRFDSISMFNLFHCIPGGMEAKVRALAVYSPLLSDRGVLAGCTVLGEDHATGWLSRWYVRYFNRVGFFNNLRDTKAGFEEALRREFAEVETWVVGMTLLFRASRPRRGSTSSGEDELLHL